MRTRWLIAAVLGLPLLDAAFLVYVAVAHLGAVATVALVVLTALVGTLLVRAEGRRTIRKAQATLARGQVPTDELLDGALLIAAGALLVTPGLVSDAVGFLLAVPLTRTPLRAALKRYVVVPYLDERSEGFATGDVYVGGVPDDGDEFTVGPGTGGAGPGPGPDAPGPGAEEYDIDIEDVTDVSEDDTDGDEEA